MNTNTNFAGTTPNIVLFGSNLNEGLLGINDRYQNNFMSNLSMAGVQINCFDINGASDEAFPMADFLAKAKQHHPKENFYLVIFEDGVAKQAGALCLELRKSEHNFAAYPIDALSAPDARLKSREIIARVLNTDSTGSLKNFSDQQHPWRSTALTFNSSPPLAPAIQSLKQGLLQMQQQLQSINHTVKALQQELQMLESVSNAPLVRPESRPGFSFATYDPWAMHAGSGAYPLNPYGGSQQPGFGYNPQQHPWNMSRQPSASAQNENSETPQTLHLYFEDAEVYAEFLTKFNIVDMLRMVETLPNANCSILRYFPGQTTEREVFGGEAWLHPNTTHIPIVLVKRGAGKQFGTSKVADALAKNICPTVPQLVSVVTMTVEAFQNKMNEILAAKGYPAIPPVDAAK